MLRAKPNGTGGTRAAATISLAIGMQKKEWRGKERTDGGDGERDGGGVENEEEKDLLEGLNLKSDQGFFLEAHFIPRAGYATTPV